MNKSLFTILISTLLLVVASCSNGSKNPSEISNRHSQWVNSLNDSLTAVRQASEENMQLIESLDSVIIELSSQFSKTANSKLVENYIVKKEFINYDTESQTGLIARITENNEFELIATLKGKNFSAIEITNGSESVKSAIVPYDKALNFRTPTANIVAFKDNKVDSIGRFISENRDKPLKLIFLLGKSKQSSIVIPKNQQEMIALTWNYVDANIRKAKAERLTLLLSEKAKIIETRINQDN